MDTTDRTARAAVVLGLLLIVGAAPPAVGHLAQDPASEGSGTSAGFGGPLVDWDPCRRHASTQQGVGNAQADAADPSTWQQAPIVSSGDTCEVRVDANGDTDFTDVNSNGERIDSANSGVSGTYIAATSTAVVECLNATNPGWSTDTAAPCEGLLFHDGWRSVGTVLCDLEWFDLLGADNEAYVDNGATGGSIPDGTFDDGGIGGACHLSGYGAGSPNNANTNGTNTDGNDEKEFNTNNAHTQCRFDDDGTAFVREDPAGNDVTDDKPYADESELVGRTKTASGDVVSDEVGTAYAEDWLLGADVPVLVGCDSAQETPLEVGIPEPIYPGLVGCLIAPDHVQCIEDRVDALLNPPPGQAVGCVPYQQGNAITTTNLGKGGGHVGDGVTVPDEVDPCDQGDVVVFVTALVSANPFGNAYDKQTDVSHNSVDEHFGWPGLDGDAQVLADWDSDGVVDGTGDTVVYPPVAGWIDHFHFLDTSPDALDCDEHAGYPSPHSDHHNHGPTGLPQDDHLGPLDTHSGPGDCGR